MNQFFNPYLYNQPTPQQNVLPPQQILQANGRSSVDNIRMSPNSSVLVADSTLPIIYKCISDGLGNVTIETFDVSVHKDEEYNAMSMFDKRLNDLEAKYESIVKRNTESNAFTSKADSPNDSRRKGSSVVAKSDGTE